MHAEDILCKPQHHRHCKHLLLILRPLDGTLALSGPLNDRDYCTFHTTATTDGSVVHMYIRVRKHFHQGNKLCSVFLKH